MFLQCLCAGPLSCDQPWSHFIGSRLTDTSCVCTTPGIAQNLNMAIKKSGDENGQTLKNLSRGGFSDVLVSRYVAKVSWQHFFCILHATGCDIWGNVTSSLPVKVVSYVFDRLNISRKISRGSILRELRLMRYASHHSIGAPANCHSNLSKF